MMPLSDKDLAECRSISELREACPVQVPEAIEEKGYFHRVAADRIGRGDEAVYIYDVEWGAPTSNRVNAEDRPPRFSHLVAVAGDVAQMFGFGWPGEIKTPKGQPPPEDLGVRSWGGRKGRLVLAPKYPFGGLFGSHLIFRWKEAGDDYAVSLHAWEPIAETEEALRQTVLSVP